MVLSKSRIPQTQRVRLPGQLVVRPRLNDKMATSKYGVVMLDHKEQYVSAGSGLNNNFLDDILKLKHDYLNNIGLTENVINGTANTEENNVYFHRVVEPCLYAIVDAVNRVFYPRLLAPRVK